MFSKVQRVFHCWRFKKAYRKLRSTQYALQSERTESARLKYKLGKVVTSVSSLELHGERGEEKSLLVSAERVCTYNIDRDVDALKPLRKNFKSISGKLKGLKAI